MWNCISIFDNGERKLTQRERIRMGFGGKFGASDYPPPPGPSLSPSKPRYANNQHKLESEISSDPKETSFFKAMQLSEGVLIVPPAAH